MNIKNILSLFSLSIFTLTTCFAHAEIIANKPEYEVGSVWKTKLNFPVKCSDWEITETDRDGYLIIQCDKYESYLDIKNDFNLAKTVDTSNNKIIAEYKPYWPGIKYPLSAGDSWRGHYQGYVASTGWHWTSSTYARVVGVENLSVKDKTYEAIKIEMTDSWKDKNNYSGINNLTYWYVPSLNAVMKMRNSDPRWNY